MIDRKKLQLAQLDQRFKALEPFSQVVSPPIGWIKTIRLSLGMSLQQLADRLGVSRQNVREMELREVDGAITLRKLREMAHAMDMKLVYAVIPQDKSLDALIERKARELALRIVTRTSNNMKLENQENSKERLQQAVDERTALIKKEVPRMLWD